MRKELWILPTIWSAYAAAADLSSGIHRGESVFDYAWNTLILAHHELAYISQWGIGAPFFSSVAYSFGAWLIPPMLGMKIIPIGPIIAIACAS